MIRESQRYKFYAPSMVIHDGKYIEFQNGEKVPVPKSFSLIVNSEYIISMADSSMEKSESIFGDDGNSMITIVNHDPSKLEYCLDLVNNFRTIIDNCASIDISFRNYRLYDIRINVLESLNPSADSFIIDDTYFIKDRYKEIFESIVNGNPNI